MISVRENVFETNSSSCHSFTLNCTKKELDDFNAGKTFYVELPGEYCNNKFHTAEEIVEAMKKVDPAEISYGCMTFTDGLDFWYDDDEDGKNYTKWFIENLNVEMFNWAFSDDPTPKYFSKKILRRTIESIAESAWYTPLYKIEDFFEYKGNICNIGFYGSNVIKNNDTKQLELANGANPRNIHIEADFRH